MLFVFFLDVRFFYSIKHVGDFLARGLIHKADYIDCYEGKDKARDDFVETEEGKLLPDKDGETTGYYTSQDAISSCAAPEQGHDEGWSECCAEACPGICYHVQNEAVWCHGNGDCHCRYYKNGQTAYPYKVSLRGTFIDYGSVKILREGRCCNQQLRRCRTHDSCKNCRQDETTGKWAEKLASHF